MKVEYVQPFVEAARSVLKQVVGGENPAGRLSLLGTTFPTESTVIATRINGALTGEVIYSMSSSTAAGLAAVLTGSKAVSFGRVMGASLGKLSTMLAGETSRILAEQGFDCHVNTPMILRGLNVEFTVTEPALSVTVDSEVGQLNVSVAVRKW